MNENNNELSDIVLNKNTSSGSNKKMLLAVATLGVILIAVVTLMKSCGSQDDQPQGVIPPKPTTIQEDSSGAKETQEPLFEDVEVIQEDTPSDADLDKIAKKLKQESVAPVKKVQKPAPKPVKEPVVKPKKEVQKPKKVSQPKKVTNGVRYFIQVGSFTRYAPNKRFLSSIKKLGYDYTFHKVNIKGKTLNKVLVGPFATQKEARDARRILRAKVEPGAFLVKLK